MQAVETKVNGIDVQGLKSMMAEIAKAPARGLAKFQVKTNWTGGTKSESRVDAWEFGGQRLSRNFTITTDEPSELLGCAAGPNPQEVLMAAVNACMMVGYVAGCAARGIELRSISIETEGALDLRGFLGLDPNIKPGYDEIRYVVRVKSDATREQLEEVHKTVMKTSPNYWNMANPIRMCPRLVME